MADVESDWQAYVGVSVVGLKAAFLTPVARGIDLAAIWQSTAGYLELQFGGKLWGFLEGVKDLKSLFTRHIH